MRYPARPRRIIVKYDNVITLYPLRSNEFKRLLETAGFSEIEFFGSFDGKPFDIDAFPMIVTAKK